MRGDLSKTYDDFERVAEDYFMLIPSDLMSFDMDLVLDWDYDDIGRKLMFKFNRKWDMENFIDKIKDCPKMGMSFEFDDVFDIDSKNNVVTIHGTVGGL